MTPSEISRRLVFLRRVAGMILENGGETYRAEDTVLHMSRACGFSDPQTLALPTGVFLSVIYGGETYSTMVRVVKRTINLGILNKVNNLSRRFTSEIKRHRLILGVTKW